MNKLVFGMGNYTLPEGSQFIGDGHTYLQPATIWNLSGNVSVRTGFSMVGSTISGAFDLTLGPIRHPSRSENG